MDSRLYLSKDSIKMLDECVEDFGTWHFDAINQPLLLAKLLSTDGAFLRDYLVEEDIDDYDIFWPIYCENRKNHLLIKDGEEVPEYTQEKVAKMAPNNFVPDDKKKAGESKNNKPVDDGKQYRSERDHEFIFYDKAKKAHWYSISDEFLSVVNVICDLAEEFNFKEIRPVHFTIAMFKAESEVLKEFFADLQENFAMAKKFFTSGTILNLGVIPYDLRGFLSCLNDNVDRKKPCQILMRDKETSQIWNICLKMNKRNTIIVGEAGVGKSALIEKITYDIVTGNCPDKFKNFSVISLDVNSLIAGTTFRGQAEERIKSLIDFLRDHDNVILFIDEVHTILGAGSCFEGEMDLANALKPILARGDTIVIGATTEEEYEKYFKRDAALTRRFEKLVVKEPKSDKVYPMIKNKIATLSKYHGVKISRSMVEYIIMIAHCFHFEKKNPDKTLDLIDRSMVAAEMSGKKMVDQACVLSNFDIFFDLFNGMSEDSRKETAYHEAGHYLIGKLSDKLVEYNMLAVSIMPAENYLGVTCYEYRDDIVPFKNKDYFIDSIAMDLGGRIAEKVFTSTITAGASEDLKSANAVAFYVVSNLGMTAEDSNNVNTIYLNTEDYPMLTEKATNMLNDEKTKMVELATKRAEAIINPHRELLDKIVKLLLKKHIVGESELDKVCRSYFQKKGMPMPKSN
jgi:GTPase SAR1 family protein